MNGCQTLPPSNPWSRGNSLLDNIKSTHVLKPAAPVETKSAKMAASVDEVFQTVKRRHPQVVKEKENNVLLANQEIINVRFSQDSICPFTTDSLSIPALTDRLRKEGWDSRYPITIVNMPDDRYTSLDNRRLFCAKSVVTTPIYSGRVSLASYPSLEISAKAFEHSEKANRSDIQGMRNSYRASRLDRYPDSRPTLPEFKTFDPDLKPGTYGELIILRMNTGEGDTYKSPLGFTNFPIIR